MRRLAPLALSACSFVAVRPLPPNQPSPGLPDCSTTRAPMVIDLVVTSVVALEGVSAANDQHDVPLAIAGGLGAVAFGVSAIYGYRQTAQCRSALAAALPGDPGHRPVRVSFDIRNDLDEEGEFIVEARAEEPGGRELWTRKLMDEQRLKSGARLQIDSDVPSRTTIHVSFQVKTGPHHDRSADCEISLSDAAVLSAAYDVDNVERRARLTCTTSSGASHDAAMSAVPAPAGP